MKVFDELLKNVGLSNPQRVDHMTVIPLVGEDQGTSLAPPQSLSFKGTRGYGTMEFLNTDVNPAIVPAHTTARAKGSGQDHAMTGVGVVPHGGSSFRTCICIEQSRGGMLSGDMDSFDVLPVGLRKAFNSVKSRTQTEFGRMWPQISSWLQGVTPTGRAHLVDFYENPKFKERLETFAAEFEPVPNQLGALILFDGIPVGIELMPTNAHWEAYWEYLIRGCYGAELVRLQELKRLGKTAMMFPKIPVGATKEQAVEVLEGFVRGVIEDIIPIFKKIESTARNPLMIQQGGISGEMIRTQGDGVGDILYQEGKPIYVSIVL
jgi:hypothetical protein